MSGISQESLRAAWDALWVRGGTYDVRTAMESGARKGLIWFKPLDKIAFPGTGPIVVCNSEPWGVVTADFTVNEVSNFHTAENGSIDLAEGKFTATLNFTELKLSGEYVVRKGVATGSAIKSAVSELFGATGGDDPNIALAKSYRDQLIQSPQGSGRFMVGSYYDNNEAYVQCFTNQNFVNAWNGTTYTTNGKNTAYFAAQTSNAAQPSNTNTVAVNADPDYTIHAFAMQSAVAVLCHKQGNQGASNAASQFSNAAGPQSKTNQTVSQVLNTVATTAPPQASAHLVAASPWREPWMPDVLEKMKPIFDAMIKEEDEVAAGTLLREQTERPISNRYLSHFAAGPLTLRGVVYEDGHGVKVECTGISGPTPDAAIKLGIFPGNLHPQLQSELDKAGFLRSVLAQKAISSLSSPAFLGYMSRMLTLAAGEKLGPLNG